jgi:hypothetical protein
MLLLLSTSLSMVIYFENTMKKHEIKIKYVQTRNYHQYKNEKVCELIFILSTNQMK